MCGLTDGLRLYNDLHKVRLSYEKLSPKIMFINFSLKVVVTPRMTFFVGLKDSEEFEALYLDELTLVEFNLKLAIILRMEVIFKLN